MDINKIPIGDNPPEALNVVIEVPVGGEPVKYEFDKASGALFVDRILHTPMRYLANYDATFPYYRKIDEGNDLPEIVMQQIEHFFTHYKDLEPEKWVRVGKWGDAEEAKRVVLEAIELAKTAK